MTGARVTTGPGRSVRRRLGACAFVAVAMAAALVGACTPTYSTTTDTTTTLLPPPRSVLRVGVEEWPTCLNPLLCSDDALRSQILQHVLPGAYRLDADNDLVPTGLLAEPAEVTLGEGPDEPAMTVRYRLSDAARWADGKPITSSDFVGTWRAVMSTPGADTTGYDAIVGVNDKDPLTAVVALNRPLAEWRELFGGSRSHLLQADAFGATPDLSGLYTDELPFAAGPYQLVSWNENEAVLSRVDNDWDPGRTASIDQVRLRPVTMSEVSPEAFDVLVPESGRTDPPEGYSVQEAPTTSVVGVWFDQRSPVMQQRALRLFLVHALDPDELVAAADGAGATSGSVGCAGWVPDVGPWCAAGAVSFTHDRATARADLAAAGATPAPDGPMVTADGLLTMPVTWDPADPVASAVGAEVTATLASFGVTVVRASMPTEQWSAPRPAAAGVGVGVFTVDLDVGAAPSIYACPAGPESSVVAWCPAANADSLQSLATTVDPERRGDLVAGLARRVQSEAVWMPVVQRSESFYVRTDRVDVPELTRVVGGPLAHLAEFTVSS